MKSIKEEDVEKAFLRAMIKIIANKEAFLGVAYGSKNSYWRGLITL